MSIEKRIWTNSRIKTFMMCPEREHFRYELEIVRSRQSKALSIGSAVHKGIEMRSVDAGTALYTASVIMNTIVTQEDADEIDQTTATIRAMITACLAHWPEFERQETEKKFEIPLLLSNGRKSRKYAIAGKFDAIAYEEGSDRPKLVEYKTAGQVTGAYFDRLQIDEQISIYMVAARILGYPVNEIIYRVVKKPQLRMRKGETSAQYADRITQDYLDRPDFYLYEQRYYRSESQLSAYELELYYKIQQFEAWKKKGAYFKNTSMCAMMGACPYLPLCTQGDDALYLYEKRKANEELEDENGGNAE